MRSTLTTNSRNNLHRCSHGIVELCSQCSTERATKRQLLFLSPDKAILEIMCYA